MRIRAAARSRRATAARFDAGLTLLEVAIAIAVLAVLGAIALPSLGARLQRQRLQFAAETLVGDVTQARLEAAQRGLTLHVQASAGATWCWAVSTAPDCTCGVAQACQLHRETVIDHPGVRMVQGPDFKIAPDGSATASGPAVFESVHGQRVEVALSPLGRARLCARGRGWPGMPAC
jgi:prepilin-type N-terminal cleavage/methylation domain-containing protein